MKKLVTALKYFINLFWGIIFLLFASVQFNDPDGGDGLLAFTLATKRSASLRSVKAAAVEILNMISRKAQAKKAAAAEAHLAGLNKAETAEPGV